MYIPYFKRFLGGPSSQCSGVPGAIQVMFSQPEDSMLKLNASPLFRLSDDTSHLAVLKGLEGNAKWCSGVFRTPLGSTGVWDTWCQRLGSRLYMPDMNSELSLWIPLWGVLQSSHYICYFDERP